MNDAAADAWYNTIYGYAVAKTEAEKVGHDIKETGSDIKAGVKAGLERSGG